MKHENGSNLQLCWYPGDPEPDERVKIVRTGKEAGWRTTWHRFKTPKHWDEAERSYHWWNTDRSRPWDMLHNRGTPIYNLARLSRIRKMYRSKKR